MTLWPHANFSARLEYMPIICNGGCQEIEGKERKKKRLTAQAIHLCVILLRNVSLARYIIDSRSNNVTEAWAGRNLSSWSLILFAPACLLNKFCTVCFVNLCICMSVYINNLFFLFLCNLNPLRCLVTAIREQYVISYGIKII